jgi:hypothetical protein
MLLSFTLAGAVAVQLQSLVLATHQRCVERVSVSVAWAVVPIANGFTAASFIIACSVHTT